MSAIRLSASAFAGCILIFSLGTLVDAEISCLDENGKPVDWFIAYKFPKLDGNQTFRAGLAYSYITSEDVEDDNDRIEARTDDSESKIFIYKFKDLLLKYLGYKAPKKTFRRTNKHIARTARNTSRWVVSDYAISDPKSMIMQTLAPAFDKGSSNVNSIFYNDDPHNTIEPIPESDSEVSTKSETEGEGDDEEETDNDTQHEKEANQKKSNKKSNINGNNKRGRGNDRRAHAKGVLLMDDKSMNGLWLTHSVPRFPKVRSWKLDYPKSGTTFGQTLMCVSFRVADSGKKLVDHLVNMRVLVYDNQISDKLYKLIPALVNLDVEEKISRRRVRVQPQLSQVITTRGGQILHLFSKSIAMNDDLYSGWIDEELGADLYVETWRNGKGNPLDSFCPKGNYHVNNIQDLKYDNKLQWAYSKDHSKWAISEEKDDSVVCIADSNRMASQFKRGGGAVCIKCPTCWDVFSNTIQDVEPCPNDNSRSISGQKESRALLDNIRAALHL